MSATFHTDPTPLHQGRPDHPSLLPPTRPILVEVGEEPPVGAERRLPGGAALLERRPTPVVAELALVGEVDAFDRGAIIDACTAVGLEGARHLRIDGSELAFVDLRILEALAKVARHFHRHGGSFELSGLREPFAAMWADIAPDTAVFAPAPQGRLDDRVVPLHAPAPTEPTRGSAPTSQVPAPAPKLRIVPDVETNGRRARLRPA
jgi:anti-anti-sigma regulatory factor